MGVFGTSKEEESDLRDAAALQPIAALASLLTLSQSQYETASEFSSKDNVADVNTVDNVDIAHSTVDSLQDTDIVTNAENKASDGQDDVSEDVKDDDVNDTNNDKYIKDFNSSSSDDESEVQSIQHLDSGNMRILLVPIREDEDDDYVVANPEMDIDPSTLTENELNRIMTSHLMQSVALQKSITRSRTHGEYIDPIDLDWDGPLDPENPNNWPVWKKWFVTLATAYTCLCISLGSSLYVPGVFEIMRKMHVSQTLGLSGLTFYLIGLAVGPVFAAPLLEMIGRRNIYITTFPISMLFTMGVGLSQNIRSILVLRFFAGLVASPPMSIAGGTVSDIWGNSPIDVAIAMAMFCVAPFLGPIIGPVVGGFAVESKGWRFTMWASLIFSGASLPMLLLSPETFKLAILKKRARLRGIKLIKPEYNAEFFVTMLKTNLVRPLEMLFVEPIVGLTSIYIAFVFAVLFGFFEAFPIVFKGVYGMSLGVSGLPFIGVGIGLIFGVVLYIILAKLAFRKAKKQAIEDQKRREKGEEVKEKWDPPENKLSAAVIGAIFLPISLFWLAWTSRKSIHWIAPTISGAPFGFGLIWVFFGVVLYYTLSFPPDYVASALAANNLLRYIMASVFPLFIVQMYDRLHIDWATSLLAFIALAMVPIPMAFMKYGGKLREHSKYGYVAYFRQQKEKAEADAAKKAAKLEKQEVTSIPSSRLGASDSSEQALEGFEKLDAGEMV